MIAGPANKHNANDNTSGVTVLCELLQTLTPDLRSKAAFVFFDNEELGLFGSIHFRSKYKRLTREKLVINLDCVSDGNAILVSASKDARKEYGKLLKDSFLFETGKEILFANAEKTYYPSDQMGFKKSVAIAALKRKWYISYYLDKIHTAQDTIFDRSNIKYLCQSILRLLNNF